MVETSPKRPNASSFSHQSLCWVIIIKLWLIQAVLTLHDNTPWGLCIQLAAQLCQIWRVDRRTPQTWLWLLSCAAVPSLHLSALYAASSANGDHRFHILHLHTILIITTLIIFAAQPTNFQHVQICRLCNPADDLTGSEHPFIKTSELNGAESVALLLSQTEKTFYLSLYRD